jgi:hypothetical protein
MSVLEFLYFSFYLLFLLANIVAIQILNPVKPKPALQDTTQLESTLQEPETSKDDYTMTENPMFRNRNQETEAEVPSEAEASSPQELPKVEKVD